MKSVNDFDKVAAFYNALASVVFGKSISQAYSQYLDQINYNSNVLIVGGGTGRILSKLRSDLKTDYLELSKKMIHHSMNRAHAQVNYIYGDFLTFEPGQKYDYIILPFFLDVFSILNLKLAIQKAKSLLAPNGFLLVADFQDTGKSYQRLLMRAMHFFFRFSVSLESSELQSIKSYLAEEGLEEIASNEYYDGMIFSSIFQCQETF